MNPELCSIKEACYLLDVAPRTVATWFDRGLLKGYRLPGERGARRITRDSVRTLCANMGLTKQGYTPESTIPPGPKPSFGTDCPE